MGSDSLGGESSTGLQVYKTSSGFRGIINLVKRSAGSFWFIYSSLPETISTILFRRTSVVSFNGSTFGSPVEIPGQSGATVDYLQTGSSLDDSSILHVIMIDPGSKNLYHSGYNGSSFGSFGLVDGIGFIRATSALLSYSGAITFAASQSGTSKTVYHATSGSLNPTWDIHNITAFDPVVEDADIYNSLPFALGHLDSNLYLFWTRSGQTPSWDTGDGLGVIQYSKAATSDLSTWDAEATILNTPIKTQEDVGQWAAAQVSVYFGTSIGLGIFGGFTGNITVDPSPTFVPVENGQFNSIPGSGGGGFPITESAADSLPAFSDIIGVYCSIPNTVSDINNSWADAVTIQMSGISGGTPPQIPGGPLPDRKLPPNSPPVAGTSCIFEFYGMETPEEVEVLPVPKKYDQLGPMRFDKIGKIFGFRVRLIPNGSISSMPYAIYGDDSESSPHLNSPLFSGSFSVRSGFDNVYEIQLPKSINTDIFRLTLGPTTDSFHRYNVLVKVHISGMQGQAKWLPIR